jgi:hypothetical protein
VWTTTPENAKELLQVSEEKFIDEVNDAFVSTCTDVLEL